MITETDGLRVATLFTADTNLEIGLGFAAPVDSNFHQAADAFNIEYFEWIVLQNIILCRMSWVLLE